MSDDQRGAYTPPSERLAFDPREPVRSGPPPVTLILSGLVLIGLIGGVAFLYRHGIRHPGASPAEVGQPVGEMKTPAPANALVPSPLQVSAANAAPTFAAEPEQPLPRQSLAPPVVAVAPAAAASPAPQAVSAAAPPPPPPTVASAEAAKPTKPLTIASLTDAAVSKPPPKPKAGVVAAAKPAPVAGAAPAAGWVQIGAFSSPALAAKGWSDIARLAPAAMAGKGKTVQPVAAGGATLYRTYITGFASRDAAEAFCGKLKTAGKSCFVK